MSDLSDLLAQLPVPDHSVGFWDELERELAQAPDGADGSQLEAIDSDGAPLGPASGSPRGPDDLDRRRRIRRWALAGAAASAAAVLAVIVATGGFSQDSAPGPVVTDPTVPTTTAPSTTSTTSAPEDDSAAFPGPEVAGLEVSASETTDLVDGQTIQVTGSDLAPGSQVAVIQCYGLIRVDGSIDACDLSNYAVASAEEAAVGTTLEVRRHIVSARGVHDCADPEPPNYCMIAVADLADIANYGVVRVMFDPAEAAPPAPVLRVASDGPLIDGARVVVHGENFVTGEVVEVGQCSLNVGCPPTHGVYTTTTDADGMFAVEIEAWNCGANAFGCRLGAYATRDAYPVVLEFSGDNPWPSQPQPQVVPSVELSDGQTVTVDLPRLGAREGQTFEARQCLDQEFPPELDPVCGSAVTGTIGPDGTTFDFTVAAAIGADLTSFPECASSAWPIPNRCHLRVETETFRYPPIDLWFDDPFS